jgi:NADPH:quinone reductase-like Zn-dependent oxidoreductase
VVVPATALALIPDELSAVDAAPLLCAGVTTYNALRESGARPAISSRSSASAASAISASSLLPRWVFVPSLPHVVPIRSRSCASSARISTWTA